MTSPGAEGVDERMTPVPVSDELSRQYAVFMQAPVPIAVWRGPNHVYDLANPAYMRSVSTPDIVGRPVREVFADTLGPDHEIFRMLDRVYETGEPIVGHESHLQFDPARTGGIGEAWLSFNLEPLRDSAGKVCGLIGISVDVTPQVRARREIEEANASLRALNRVGQRLAAELSHEKLITILTDEATALCGAKFGAYFYNVVNQAGESYMLYALSGAPREAFERFGMPRNTAVFAPTFAGEGVVRSDDILADPRYGHNSPHRGMPKGHLPVRSYLAVSLASRSGEVLGGLFLGHPEPGRFTEKHEALITAIAAQAAVAIDTAKLLAETKKMGELQRRRARQAALSADVALALNAGGGAANMLSRCCQAAVDHLDAAFARIWTVSADGAHLELQASAGLYTHLDGPHRRVPIGAFKIGLIASEKRAHVTNDLQHDDRLGDRGWAVREGLVSFAGYPLVVEGTLVGVMAMFGRQPLADDTLETLASVANHVALGLERRRAEAQAQRERKRLADVFRQAPAAMALLHGPELRFETANHQYLELCGKPDIVGKPIRDAFPEPRYLGRIEAMERAYATGEPALSHEMPVSHPGDEESTGYYNIVYQPIQGAGGRTESIVLMAVEVTDMVRARQSIQESEERYRFVSEVNPNQLWTATPDGALDYVNERTVAYFGRPASEIIGAGWQAVLHPDDVGGVVEKWTRSLRTGDPYEVEFRLRRADGVYRWHIGRSSALRDGGGRVLKWFGSNVDVDESHRLVSALGRSNRELDQFAYVASHDLKAPLRGIANLAQWVEEDLGDTLTADAGKHLALMKNRVYRMEALIDGILQYSRAGRTRDKVESIDVGELVREAVELLQPSADARVIIGSGMPVLEVERAPLQQLFLNLVGNALKHAKRGDALVEVTSRDLGTDWEFAIHDNGPGIAAQFHAKIWGLFSRLGNRDEVEGAGIGLAVVKKIVESRGGVVSVQSSEGAGATFRFTWPKIARGDAV